MRMVLDLPAPLGDELLRGAEREHVSALEHAKILLSVASALRKDHSGRAFPRAVRAFLSARSLDADAVVAVFDELVVLLLKTGCDPVSIDEDYDVSVSELPPLEALVQRAGRVRRPAARGKYSHVGVSSSAFARDKETEIDLEARDRQ